MTRCRMCSKRLGATENSSSFPGGEVFLTNQKKLKKDVAYSLFR